MQTPQPPASLWRRLGWMALIWAASVLLLGLVALVIRWFLH
ncbi:DUF2474 family protein [Sphingomonas sp. KRR8]|nr:DUF2474 family protein [Sphingomonas sp. KRR8]URD61119.1 DUF2474 family protein [Sphingomonas sp. KRR8]